MTIMDGATGGKRKGKRGDGGGAADSSAMAGVPIFLRDLLSKLPPHSGPLPNVDLFLDQLRKTVLPPRPVVDEDAPVSGASSAGAVAEDVVLAGSGKRSALEVGGDDDDDDDGAVGNRDDVFRKRRRLQLTAMRD